MDTHLKERLVGAAVLVAAAVILIPEMLSGPSERIAAPAGGESVAGEGGVKTYTIDLGNRARSGADDNDIKVAVDAPVPAVTEAPTPQAEAQAPVVPPAEDDDTAAVAQLPAPPRAVPAATAPVATPAAVRQAPSPTRSANVQDLPWVVQVGSFASQATAEKLSQDLKRRGYTSFVVPFKRAAQTLFRVRVGPMQDRSEAEAVVQKLKREGTAAAVVANS